MNEYIVDGHSGILIDIGDSISFSKKIELIINDEGFLKKIAENLNNRIMELGSPKTFTRNIVRIIDEI